MKGCFLLSGVVHREAAGGRFLLKTGFPTGASPALPDYPLSEVFFAGRGPDDKYESEFKDEKLSDYFL